MNRFRSQAAYGVLIVLIIAGFAWVKRYSPFALSGHQPQLANIALQLEGVRLAGRSNGRPAWRLDSQVVEVSRDRAYATFLDLQNGVVYDRGKPAIALSARKLVYDSRTKNMRARDATASALGHKLAVSTHDLYWLSFQRRLVCPERVTIETGAGRGQAASLVADLKNSELTLTGVKLRIPSTEQPLLPTR